MEAPFPHAGDGTIPSCGRWLLYPHAEYRLGQTLMPQVGTDSYVPCDNALMRAHHWSSLMRMLRRKLGELGRDEQLWEDAGSKHERDLRTVSSFCLNEDGSYAW